MGAEPAERFEAALEGLDEACVKRAEGKMAIGDGSKALSERGFLSG